MTLNKEKSKTFKRILAFTIAELISLSPGLKISSKAYAETKQINTREEQEEAAFEGEKDWEKKQYEYLKNIAEADLSDYDLEFLDFYHNGVIHIEGREDPIKVSELLIISRGQDDDIEYHVVSYKDINHDIFTDADLSDFNRDYLLDFMNSNCFYSFYLSCKENNCIDNNEVHITNENKEIIMESLEGYDKTMHEKAPETYYLKKR